ncbi:zf-HC2 domain-containing protein [Jiangella aurantiaca]|uniref:Zf-HC2 domain-containing protein n=1 Tax=Jiangella aurantiaca TaxID=2530373 RepID=A0A4R5AHC1_9ACTN|nr:zf-HC2 domain-containing protein [Jiangella aurantiaca]TDD72023.1 zf-HC2 domain-containing protein [Jiangella aurantiaca]
MISCGEAVRHLWEFLDRGLSDENQRAVEEHLAWCVRCCGELEFARSLRQLLRTTAEGGVPDDVRNRLSRFIDDLDHID